MLHGFIHVLAVCCLCRVKIQCGSETEEKVMGVIPILKPTYCPQNAWLMYGSSSCHFSVLLVGYSFFCPQQLCIGPPMGFLGGFVALNIFVCLCFSSFVYLTLHSAVPVSVRLILLKKISAKFDVKYFLLSNYPQEIPSSFMPFTSIFLLLFLFIWDS